MGSQWVLSGFPVGSSDLFLKVYSLCFWELVLSLQKAKVLVGVAKCGPGKPRETATVIKGKTNEIDLKIDF